MSAVAPETKPPSGQAPVGPAYADSKSTSADVKDLKGSDLKSDVAKSDLKTDAVQSGVGKKVEERKKVLFAIDIEGSGASFTQNGIVAIGWCVGDMRGNVLEKKRVSLQLLKRVFEPRCKSQYWDVPAQAAQLKVFEAEAIHPYEAMKQFMEAVDKYERLYDLVILSDNPSYDIAWINYYLDLFLGRSPLSYEQDQSTYRGVKDQHQFAFGRRIRKHQSATTTTWAFDMNKYKTEYEILKTTSPHDHWPENDAEAIYRKTLLLDSC